MNRPILRSKELTSALVAVVAATPQVGDAALYTATLQQVLTYSNNGTAGTAGNISSSTATWTYDDVANVVTQSGGTYNVRFTTASTTTLFRTSITGLVVGNGAPATATTYACTEGNFGANVGASICGNYNFGANAVNNSTTTWGPGTSVSRTLGGDDGSIGQPQSIATLDTMNTSSFNSGGTLVITNKTCTGPCATLAVGANNVGQQWTFSVALPDSTPVPFDFSDQDGVDLSVPITSNAVTINGINLAVPIAVDGGEFSIDGGEFTGTAGTVTNGNTVRVRHMSADAPDTAVDTTLTVGGISDTFTSTTLKYAIDDVATTSMGQPIQINVLQNDNRLANTVFVGIWIEPAHGAAVVTGAPGTPAGISVTYTPVPGYSGPDSFEYWVESGLVVDYGLVNVTVTNPDVDGDGVLNEVDNCTTLANPAQCDSDGDGYGNRCDGDLTNNGFTNAQDSVVLRTRLGTASTAPQYNAADLNCNGFINAQDTALFRQLLGKPPGPAGQGP